MPGHNALGVEKERFNPAGFTPNWVVYEHEERYRFAAAFARGRTLVDAACGSGEGTRTFAEAGARWVHAFDIDPVAVAATAERCKGLDVDVSRSDAGRLPLADGAADVFVSFETIEHMEQPDALIAEAHRVLRPGGVFICSTPNREVYSPGATDRTRPWNRFHVREFTTEEFAASLARHFPDCRIYGQNPRRPGHAALLGWLGRRLPGHSAVRINQASKLPRLLSPRRSRHAVQPGQADRVYEFNVAVCTKQGS